jgi:hypothetical protein
LRNAPLLLISCKRGIRDALAAGNRHKLSITELLLTADVGAGLRRGRMLRWECAQIYNLPSLCS